MILGIEKNRSKRHTTMKLIYYTLLQKILACNSAVLHFSRTWQYLRGIKDERPEKVEKKERILKHMFVVSVPEL